VDIVAEGYDAGIRLSEIIERDIVSVIYFPSRAQRSTPLRLFVDTAKELLFAAAPRRF